jgi:hypothetical protein
MKTHAQPEDADAFYEQLLDAHQPGPGSSPNCSTPG